jgi:hypothetical protein
MSDRSAKLLLEVAATLELADVRQHSTKMAGSQDVQLSRGLWQDIVTWSRGYREHLETKQQRKSLPRKQLVADGWWLVHVTDGELDGVVPYIEQAEEE